MLNICNRLLDEFIKIAQGLKLQVENIGSEIGRQAKLIKSANDKAEKARINLEKRNSALLDVLNKYRS